MSNEQDVQEKRLNAMKYKILKAEQENLKLRPKMNLAGHDGNIYAIMGRAARVLRESGQNRESVEMRRRVIKCDNYYKALGIISEYVETELSIPQELCAETKRKPERKTDEPER